jgi:EpsI family protein
VLESDPDVSRGKASRRQLLMGGCLIGVASLAFARMPTPGSKPLKPGQFEASIPKTVGQWSFATASGLVLPPEDELSDRLYDEVLTRVYDAPGAPSIMFLIAYSHVQDGLLQLHRPEICYPVGGFSLTETQTVALPLGNSLILPVKTFSARASTRTEHVLYWTRVGEDIPSSWSRQRWSVVQANLKGEIPDGILVRVSVLGADAREGLTYVESFVRALIPALDPKTRALMIGPTERLAAL